MAFNPFRPIKEASYRGRLVHIISVVGDGKHNPKVLITYANESETPVVAVPFDWLTVEYE